MVKKISIRLRQVGTHWWDERGDGTAFKAEVIALCRDPPRRKGY